MKVIKTIIFILRCLQEVKELMDQLSRDSDQDYKNMFRNELTLAIRDIRTEYENMAQMGRPDSDNWYKAKVRLFY